MRLNSGTIFEKNEKTIKRFLNSGKLPKDSKTQLGG